MFASPCGQHCFSISPHHQGLAVTTLVHHIPCCTRDTMSPTWLSNTFMTEAKHICRYQTRLSLPITGSTQQLSTHVESAISAESQRIQQSVGSIQGSIATSIVSVADVQQPVEIQLLSPPACCATAEQQDTREASVSGRVLIEGVLHGRAMVSKKDLLAAAVDFLKVST